MSVTQRNRTQARDFKDKRENQWRNNARPNDWQPLDMNNADFEEYYRRQQVVPDGEWEAFMASLRSMLPTTFRINGSGKFAEELRNRLQTNFLASFGDGPVKVTPRCGRCSLSPRDEALHCVDVTFQCQPEQQPAASQRLQFVYDRLLSPPESLRKTLAVTSALNVLQGFSC